VAEQSGVAQAPSFRGRLFRPAILAISTTFILSGSQAVCYVGASAKEGVIMSATVKSLGIDRLGLDERLNLVEEIWETLGSESENISLTPAQRAELERRVAEDDANPDNVAPWEEVKASTLSRLG
jgi:putative addiction module component (TIGR02574 family)